MLLLFNILSRFVITFLPRSKCLLILWLQSLSTVILEPKKIVGHCFHFFPIYLPWSNGTRYIVMDTLFNVPVLKKIDLMCHALTTKKKKRKKRTQETMMAFFIVLIVVIASWLSAYVQTHQVVYTKYLQFFVYQLCFNKAV